MKTGIIIPCYNEENRLNTQAFIEFITKNEDYHLCFVNDGSKHNTIDVLKEIQKIDTDKVSIVDVKKNKGKASAVRSGVRYLYNKRDIDYIGFIDADLSTDFKCFKSLVDKLENNNNLTLVYGSRCTKGGGNIERNLIRGIFSKIISSIIFFITGLPIEDTQCGAKVFRADITPVLFNKPFLSKWLFDVEMFIRLKNYYGKQDIMNKIHEKPLTNWVHVDDSKLGLKDMIKIPYVLLTIWYSYNVLSDTPLFSSLGIDQI